MKLVIFIAETYVQLAVTNLCATLQARLDRLPERVLSTVAGYQLPLLCVCVCVCVLYCTVQYIL